MRHIFTFLMLAFAGYLGAQTSNLVVFNNSGEQFFVVLNGIKQNALPKTNVRIEGLKPVAYDIKLIFADGKTSDINKRVFLEPDLEYSTRVVIKNAKKGKLRLLDMVPLNQSASTAETIVFRQDNAANFSDQQNGQQTPPTGTPLAQPVPNSGTQPAGQQGNGTHTHADGTVHNAQHQPVKPATGTHTHADGSVHNDHDHGTPPTPPTSPAGTHTHADGTVHNAQHQPVNPPAGLHTHADGTVHQGSHYPGPAEAKPVRDAQGNISCSGAVADIEPLFKDITAQTFASDKKAHAKAALTELCINSDQAYRIVNAFTFEGDKLEIAKLCYTHLVDKSAAEKLTSLFTFEATKKEFREYIQKNK